MFTGIYNFVYTLLYGIGFIVIVIGAILLTPYIMQFITTLIHIIIAKTNHIEFNKNKEDIEFDEFADIEKVIKQEEKDKKEIRYHNEVLGKVYNDTFIESHNKYKNFLDIEAIIEAQSNIEEAKKDLYDFRRLDSVKIKNGKKPEGAYIRDIKANQKEFDAELFKNWSMQIFKCIKIGNKEELEILKKVMTSQLYNNLTFQMKEFKKDGLKFVTEDLMIKEVSLVDYAKGMSKEEIKVFIKAKMREYIVEEDNGNIIRGNKKKVLERKVVMTFLKQNKEDEEGFITNCPNCGAETAQVEFGKCAYCDTLVFPIRYNWTLTKFETI